MRSHQQQTAVALTPTAQAKGSGREKGKKPISDLFADVGVAPCISDFCIVVIEMILLDSRLQCMSTEEGSELMHGCWKNFTYLITLREIKDETALASQKYVWNTSCTLLKELQYCLNTCFLFRLLLAFGRWPFMSQLCRLAFLNRICCFNLKNLIFHFPCAAIRRRVETYWLPIMPKYRVLMQRSKSECQGCVFATAFKLMCC